MGRILRCVVAALTVFACEAWAQADANLQSLFVGLTQGSEVTLVTPTADQIRIAMFGGTLTPPSGPAVLLPGVVPGAAAVPGAAPIVAPGGRPVVPSR